MKIIESSQDIKQYWPIVKRHWLSASGVFISVFVLLSIVATLKKPSYLAEGKLKFERTNTTSSLTGVGTELGKLEPLVQDKSNPLYTEAEVIRSVPVVNKTLSTLQLKDDKGMPLKSKTFLQRLSVKEAKGADVLTISYQDINSERAAKVVNTLMAIYLEHNVSAHRTQVTAARRFLEKQVPNAEIVVREAEAELAKFKEKYQIVSLQEEVNQAVGIIAELQKQMSASQSNLANVDAQSQAIRQQLGMNSQQAVMMTSLSQTSGVQDILKEIQQLESQLAARRTVLQNDHPQIIDLEEKLKSLNELLQQRIHNGYRNKLNHYKIKTFN